MRSNIQEGGAAMTAYAKMQFMQMKEIERESIVEGYKYCELDLWQWLCCGNIGMISSDRLPFMFPTLHINQTIFPVIPLLCNTRNSDFKSSTLN